MASEREWGDRARAALRAEMARREVGYIELAERLSRMGLPATGKALSNKVGRGMFSAGFFCACMTALGCKAINLETFE